MKMMRLDMDHIWCFSWLSERSQKVFSISVIRYAMSSGVVAYVSPIAYAVTKLQPRSGGLFIDGEV